MTTIVSKPATPGGMSLTPERQTFKALVFANPNYFGNLSGSPFKPVVSLQANTTYEELTSVGYHPTLHLLGAVVQLKKEAGYDGTLCTAGSHEYVRFYLSFDGGATWEDQGLASFNVWDLHRSGTLDYAVRLGAKPRDKKACTDEESNLARVRAILSWNQPPPEGTPHFKPVWGNVKETSIQLDPWRLKLSDFIGGLQAKLPGLSPAGSLVLDKLDPLPGPKAEAAPKLSAAALLKLYAGKGVPEHRALAPQLHKATARQGTSGLTPLQTMLHQQFQLDLSAVVQSFLATSGDTSFEELTSLGYDPGADALVATLKVKRPGGYSGPLCSAGSDEVVAFWVDWGDGPFQYAGTTAVSAYDIASTPAGGLDYAVSLPLNAITRRRPCQAGPVLARVRAVLSWQVAPPPASPDFVPRWGNRLEAHLHVAPGPKVPDGQRLPILHTVGAVAVDHIDASGFAQDDDPTQKSAADDSPFGGRIDFAGVIANGAAGTQYRVVSKPRGAPESAYVPLRNEPDGIPITIFVVNGVQVTSEAKILHSDNEGWYGYEDYSWAHAVNNRILTRWYSKETADGQAYDVRLEVKQPDSTVAAGAATTILIDNRLPHAALSFLDPNINAGVTCADFGQGQVIEGRFSATDGHFGTFGFVLRPSDPAHGAVVQTVGLPSSQYPDISGVVDGAFRIDTSAMAPCGYSLTLYVADRTNVDSGARHHQVERSVGFCVRAKP